MEPFNGKSGSVLFCGLTYQSVEEAKMVSALFDEKKGSYLWVLGPAVFILSLIMPQFFLGNAVQAVFKDELLVGVDQSSLYESFFPFQLFRSHYLVFPYVGCIVQFCPIDASARHFLLSITFDFLC